MVKSTLDYQSTLHNINIRSQLSELMLQMVSYCITGHFCEDSDASQ